MRAAVVVTAISLVAIGALAQKSGLPQAGEFHFIRVEYTDYRNIIAHLGMPRVALRERAGG